MNSHLFKLRDFEQTAINSHLLKLQDLGQTSTLTCSHCMT